MTAKQRTVVVTGASRGIGAAVAKLFLDRGYNVVGTSRSISRNSELPRSDRLALVDGDIGLASTAEEIVDTAVKQMLSQKTGGSVVSITASLADHPQAAFTASVPMITKGGINAISRSLAMEYAKEGIRVNVVAPGVVDTPLLENTPKDFLRTLSPLGQIAASRDIAEAVFYLTEASQVTGEVLHVDGGAHVGRW